MSTLTLGPTWRASKIAFERYDAGDGFAGLSH
jgi:hypothetical protein